MNGQQRRTTIWEQQQRCNRHNTFYSLSRRYVPLRELPSNSTSLGRGTNDQYFQNSSTVENSQTAFMDCDHLKGAKTGRAATGVGVEGRVRTTKKKNHLHARTTRTSSFLAMVLCSHRTHVDCRGWAALQRTGGWERENGWCVRCLISCGKEKNEPPLQDGGQDTLLNRRTCCWIVEMHRWIAPLISGGEKIGRGETTVVAARLTVCFWAMLK